MKQLARLMEDRIPELWSPVTRTVHCPSASWLRIAALELGAAGRLLDRAGAGGSENRQRLGLGHAHEHQQCLAHELIERHHRRHRVPGQSEEMRGADLAVGERAARASWRSSRTARRPACASSCLTKSASPTDTPPLVITTSARLSGLDERCSIAAGSSRITPMSMTSTPRRVSMP